MKETREAQASKAKVALAALQGEHTIAELASRVPFVCLQQSTRALVIHAERRP